MPGVVDGWNELLTKHGTITLAQALEPAIGYARDGYAVSEIIVVAVARGRRHAGARSERRGDVPAPAGKPPAAGDVFKNPALAASLEQIAQRRTRRLLQGPDRARRSPTTCRSASGLITAADLAAHHADWVEPISTTYRGYKVLELPPNTQGVVALEMLNILEGFDLKALGHNTAAYLHLLVEAKRIAFADRDAWLGDPSTTPARRRRADAVEGLRRVSAARRSTAEHAAARLRAADARRPVDAGRRRASAGDGRHDLPDRRGLARATSSR